MNQQDRLPVKAMTPAEQSDSIIVSFGSDWHQRLVNKKFSVVIRKRIPKSSDFKWLYFHVNSPVGAICGRAAIKGVFTATTKEAIDLAKQINLSPDEIETYIGGDNKIGCYKLGSFDLAIKPVSAAELAVGLIYHPPQSFLIMSKNGKAIIDQMIGFSTSRIGQSKSGKP